MLTQKTTRLFLVVTWVLLLSCEKAKLPLDLCSSGDYRYPFQAGNQWQYNYQMLLSSPDSLITNLAYSVAVIYLGLDSPITGGEVLHHLQSSFIQQNKSYQSDVWYRQNEQGLWEIAYRVSGGPLALPKAILSKKINPAPLLLDFWLQSPLTTISSDSVIFRDLPRLVLSYPLFFGKSWLEFKTPWQQTDYMLNQLEITTSLGSILCWQIRREGATFANSHTTFVDYFSDLGLISRLFECDIVLTDEDHPEGYGTGHAIETLVLNAFKTN